MKGSPRAKSDGGSQFNYDLINSGLIPKSGTRGKWDPPWDFDWSNQRLWALDIPVTEIHIKRLSWILLRPIWSTIKGKDLRDLVPFDVIENPGISEDHYQRLLKAESHFPIDCMWIGGRYHILDGVHRLAKNR